MQGQTLESAALPPGPATGWRIACADRFVVSCGSSGRASWRPHSPLSSCRPPHSGASRPHRPACRRIPPRSPWSELRV